MYVTRGLIDEESWLDVMLAHDIADAITLQKSSFTDKENGEVHEFKNNKFVEYVRDKPELRTKMKKLIKQALYIEQDPYVRTEEVVLEPLKEGEDI